MQFMYFSIKYHYSDILLKNKKQINFFTVCFAAITLHGFCVVSVRHITSASRQHRLYQSRSSMNPTEFRGIGRGSSDWCLTTRTIRTESSSTCNFLFLCLPNVLILHERWGSSGEFFLRFCLQGAFHIFSIATLKTYGTTVLPTKNDSDVCFIYNC